MGKTIDIGGRIHNPEVGNIVTGANEILDDTKNKKQDVINSEVDSALEALEANKQDNLTFDQTPTESSTNPVTSGGVYAADALLQQAIEAILVLIPSAATALNQLADKAFVNSTVATNTATFRGTYNVVTDLGLAYNASHQDIATALLSHIATADNNDYAFVQIPVSGTSEDIRVTERYKFNGTVWGYEYDLNNSGFTALQWAAINSGITALLVEKLGALPTAAELALALAGKQATLTFDNVPTSGSNNPVKSGGLYELFTGINAKFPTDASADNKLVAENRLAAYVAAIIGALDASFDLTSADGHITFRMTQTNGVIASVQILTSDIASASQVSTNTADIAALQALYNALQQSAPQIIQPTDTWPVANPSGTVIYRVIDRVNTPPQYYSDYMWNGTNMVLMATYNNAIDAVPTAGSNNLVKSGGVYNYVNTLFDFMKYFTSDSDLSAFSQHVKIYNLKINGDVNQYDRIYLGSAGFNSTLNAIRLAFYKATPYTGNTVVADGYTTNIESGVHTIHCNPKKTTDVSIDVTVDFDALYALPETSSTTALIDLTPFKKQQDDDEAIVKFSEDARQLPFYIIRGKMITTAGAVSDNANYDLVIFNIENTNSVQFALNGSYRRAVFYTDDPLGDFTSNICGNVGDQTAANTYKDTVRNDLAKYVVFMADHINGYYPYALSFVTIYSGLSLEQIKKHLDEVADNEDYDYRNDYASFWKYPLSASKNVFNYTPYFNSFWLKIKDGIKYVRVYSKRKIIVRCFSELPSVYDLTSLTGEPNYYTGFTIPEGTKYALIELDQRVGYEDDQPVTVRQVKENGNYDINVCSIAFEKTIDLPVTQSAIANIFANDYAIGNCRGASIVKLSDSETFVSCGEGQKGGILFFSVSDEGVLTRRSLLLPDEGKNYAYQNLIKDLDNNLHVFIASYVVEQEEGQAIEHFVSEDQGYTWTFVEEITYSLTLDNVTNNFMTSSTQGMVMKSGKLVVPIYDYMLPQRDSAGGVIIYDTSDNSYDVYVFRDKNNTVNECGVIEISDNVLMLSFRTQDRLCRVTYLLDLNEEAPTFKLYDRFDKNICAKNTENFVMTNGIIARTGIKEQVSGGANDRSNPCLLLSVDFGKSFYKAITLYEGRTYGEAGICADGLGYIAIPSVWGNGFRLIKLSRS